MGSMSRKNWISRWTYILSDQFCRKGRILRHEDLGVSGQRKKQIQGRCRSESSRHCGYDDGADSDYCRAVFFPVRFFRDFQRTDSYDRMHPDGPFRGLAVRPAGEPGPAGRADLFHR